MEGRLALLILYFRTESRRRAGEQPEKCGQVNERRAPNSRTKASKRLWRSELERSRLEPGNRLRFNSPVQPDWNGRANKASASDEMQLGTAEDRRHWRRLDLAQKADSDLRCG